MQRVRTQQELGAHLLQAFNAQCRDRIRERGNHRRVDGFHEQMQVLGCRPVEHIACVGCPGRVLEPEVLAQPVLSPHRVIEAQRNARLISRTVEGADGAHLTGPCFVHSGIGVDVVQNMQQRHSVLVLRKVEEASVSTLNLFDPVVGARLLRGHRHRPGNREARRRNHA